MSCSKREETAQPIGIPSPIMITASSIPTRNGREETTEISDTEDAEDSKPPLLQPDPSRIVSCLRAPCLKRTMETALNREVPSHFSGTDALLERNISSGSDSNSSSSSSSSSTATAPTASAKVYSYSGIKTLCAALPKRQVHFDAAPPEAGLTHSGDRYDRRPIECTQGGSQLDLRLPPRGTCSLYTEDADDEACDEEEESEESKQLRIRGFAKWARLKNGGCTFGGFASSKLTNVRRVDESTSTGSSSCSTPVVHGLRSIGRLAGQSGVVEHTDEVDSRSMDKIEADNGDGFDDSTTETFAVVDDDEESEDRHEAFRKAVCASLSKDPNATPMPSPSVRPRWECVTSYFEADKTAEEAPISEKAEESTTSTSIAPRVETKSGVKLPQLFSREHEACKVSTWTQAQADHTDATVLPNAKAAFGLTLPPAKCSPSPSLAGSSSVTNPSSSPMSSRSSSSDIFGSDCGIGQWSGSELDAFDAAFSKNMTNTPKMSSPVTHPTADSETTGAVQAPTHIHPSALGGDNDAQLAVPDMPSRDVPYGDSDHHDVEHTSSSSSGGGAGWLSSCATSPEMQPIDGGNSERSASFGSKSIKAALMQHLAPLKLERSQSQDFHIIHASTGSSPSNQSLLARLGAPEIVSSPTSGESSPYVMSAGEEEGGRCAMLSFRCSSKKTRKGRRTASGSDVRGGEEASPDGTARSSGSPRSRSMTASPSLKRSTSLKKTSAFVDSFDDEGALGGF